jgi:hypothetical protein
MGHCRELSLCDPYSLPDLGEQLGCFEPLDFEIFALLI